MYVDVPWCCGCVVADLVVLRGVLPLSVLLSVFESLVHTSLFSGGFFLKAISGGSGNISLRFSLLWSSFQQSVRNLLRL